MKILVTAHALVGGAAMLSACGQKGALFLPSTPESAGRATLPQTLKVWPANAAPASPAKAALPQRDAAEPTSASTPSLSTPAHPSLNGPLNAPAANKITPP